MKLFAKITAAALIACLSLCMVGCSSSAESTTQASTPNFEAQQIEVNDLGYSITPEGMLRYGFVAVNPNEGHVAQDVTFTVEAYDDEGSMIAGGGDTLPVMYPGNEVADAGEIELFSLRTENPEVASLSIVAVMDSVSWADTTISADDLDSSIDIIDPHMLNSGDDAITINASVKFAEGDAMSIKANGPVEMRAVALFFNESGQAICGTDSIEFALSPDGDSYTYSATLADVPDYMECNLYVTPYELIS